MKLRSLVKKGFAYAASACLCLGSLSVTAFADGEDYVPQEGYHELSEAYFDTQVDMFFFCMDQGWSWIQPDTTAAKLEYKTPGHISLAAPAENTFFNDSESLTRIGFRVGYFTEAPELADVSYDIKFNIKNMTFTFDGYDPIVVGDLTNDSVEWDESSSGLLFVESYFPDLTVAADMMRHLSAIDFDYEVYYLGATGLEEIIANATEPAETEPVETEPAETEPASTEEETSEEETSEEETTEEKTTEEKTTEEETAKKEETKETEPEASSEAASTEEAKDDGEGSGNVKVIITIVASVILVGALAAVAIVYVKKSKMV